MTEKKKLTKRQEAFVDLMVYQDYKQTKCAHLAGYENPGVAATTRARVQPEQLPAAAGVAQEYSAMVVDDASGEVGKDRCEGDSTLEVRDVPTGGGRRAATTARSDPGADRTTGDATRGVSIRLRSPVGQKYEEVFGESDGECMASGQKTTPKPICGGGGWHQDAL